MIELTEQQQQDLKHEGWPPRFVHPRTQETFVLLSAAMYERVVADRSPLAHPFFRDGEDVPAVVRGNDFRIALDGLLGLSQWRAAGIQAKDVEITSPGEGASAGVEHRPGTGVDRPVNVVQETL